MKLMPSNQNAKVLKCYDSRRVLTSYWKLCRWCKKSTFKQKGNYARKESIIYFINKSRSWKSCAWKMMHQCSCIKLEWVNGTLNSVIAFFSWHHWFIKQYVHMAYINNYTWFRKHPNICNDPSYNSQWRRVQDQ